MVSKVEVTVTLLQEVQKVASVMLSHTSQIICLIKVGVVILILNMCLLQD